MSEQRLSPFSLQRSALALVATHWKALGLAYVAICGPWLALSWAGALEFLGDWGVSILFALLLALLDTLFLTLLAGRPWTAVWRAFPGLVLVRVLRSLALAAVAVSVVLVPPVLAWFWLAEPISVVEGTSNPFQALRESRERVRGYTLRLLLGLLPLGGPMLLGSAFMLSLADHGDKGWLYRLGNVALDWVGLALTAVAFEMYRRLTVSHPGPPDQGASTP